MKAQFSISVNNREYKHQTNVDSSSIRVCNTNTKRPIDGVRLEKGETYALLSCCADRTPTYFENSLVSNPHDVQNSKKHDVGIYTFKRQYQ